MYHGIYRHLKVCVRSNNVWVTILSSWGHDLYPQFFCTLYRGLLALELLMHPLSHHAGEEQQSLGPDGGVIGGLIVALILIALIIAVIVVLIIFIMWVTHSDRVTTYSATVVIFLSRRRRSDKPTSIISHPTPPVGYSKIHNGDKVTGVGRKLGRLMAYLESRNRENYYCPGFNMYRCADTEVSLWN